MENGMVFGFPFGITLNEEYMGDIKRGKKTVSFIDEDDTGSKIRVIYFNMHESKLELEVDNYILYMRIFKDGSKDKVVYSRSYKLPLDSDIDNVKAKVSQDLGVVITIPKRENKTATVKKIVLE